MTQKVEEQVIEGSDVGSLDLKATAESPESAPVDEVESVADEIETVELEMGKVPDEIRPKFTSLFANLMALSDIVDHSPTSRRYHFKVKKENGGKFGVGLLFYGRNPKLVLNFAVEGQKKQKQIYYDITEKAVVGPDEETLTVKSIQSIIRKFKRNRGL